MKRFMLLFASLATLLVACDESGFDALSEPTLSLTTTQSTFFTQEPVVFYIDSDADYLSFYSGERGNEYEYATKERIYEGEAYISFNTGFQAGGQWKNQLEEDVEKKIIRFFYSTDFSGEYTMEAIEAATWTELTEQFDFPTQRSTNAKNSKETTPSGEKNLRDIIAEEDWGKPIYFGYRYKIDAFVYKEDGSVENPRSRVSVMNFQITKRCEEVNASESLASLSNAGWQFAYSGYDAELDANNMPALESSYIWFDCSTNNHEARVCWAITAPIVIDTDVNIGCDYGVGIKAFPDEPLKSYTYTYAEPGEYNVAVTAAKVDYMGNRTEKTSTMKITVVEQGEADIEQPTEGEW